MTGRKKILLNAFYMNSVGHQVPGMWRHPRDRSMDYADTGYWADLARLLERGLFDGIFLADVVGVYDVFGGSPDAALRNANQVPINDPSLIVPVMAHVTKHLGFGLTFNTSYEPLYLLARRISTLDHLTGGRVAWNVVTGFVDSAARAMGLPAQGGHDDRYDAADEYLSAAYRLWEESWGRGSVLRDRERGIYADASRIRRIDHDGPHYRMSGVHLSEPSPQRTPVIFQAGASPRGRAFAARHAECVFVTGKTKASVAALIADVRRQAEAFGRSGDDIRFFAGLTAVVGRTEKEAREKFEEYRRYVSMEGALAQLSASTGIDLSGYGPDDRLSYVNNNAKPSDLRALTGDPDGETWSLRQIFDRMALGNRQPVVVGSAAQVADEMEGWVEEAGLDGFNVSRVVTPESLEDFIDLVVPELQSRGLFKESYAEGTLREKLFPGGAAGLPATHPAVAHLRAAAR